MPTTNAILKVEHLRTRSTACEDLRGADEAWMLRLFALHFERTNPAVCGRKMLASICNCSVKHIEQATEGITFLSVAQWAAVQDAAGVKWFTEWMSLNFPQLTNHKEDAQ